MTIIGSSNLAMICVGSIQVQFAVGIIIVLIPVTMNTVV